MVFIIFLFLKRKTEGRTRGMGKTRPPEKIENMMDKNDSNE
jgi:hypothetical protein